MSDKPNIADQFIDKDRLIRELTRALTEAAADAKELARIGCMKSHSQTAVRRALASARAQGYEP